MSRVYRTKKEVEQFLIREYVRDVLGYTISQPKWPDSPDAILTLRKKRCKKRVAIEHTGYFNDTAAGTRSPLTPVSDFWEQVQRSLSRRISHRKHLADIMGRVRLNQNQLTEQLDTQTRVKLARQYAQELVDFLEDRTISDSHFVRYPSPSVGRYPVIFSGFPVLKSMIASLLITRTPGLHSLPHCSWLCDNIATGCIGLNLDYIRTCIERKNKKAINYNWQSVDEKWLLIVAAGGSLSEHAGPPDDRKWNDSALREFCCVSPFEKIIFWERPRSWRKSIKPWRRIIQWKN